MNAENTAGKHFKVFFSGNNEKNARLGIIASKRIFSHATDRNSFKRMVREAFRQHHIKTRNIDLVVMAKRADMQSLADHELIALFNRIESKCVRS